MSQAYRGECAFDWICGADVAPVLGREVIERQQPVSILSKTVNRRFILRLKGILE